MKRFLNILLSLGALTGTTNAFAQEFTIRQVELTAESIILHYDLIDTVVDRTYTINVYSSRDNFLAPLVKVKGDAGIEVRPGEDRKIVWSSKEELGATFHGDVELEIRGRVYIPFVRFTHFNEDRVIRRGKATTMTWTGGTRQNILNFAVYKGDEFIAVIPGVANTGSYDIVLPTNIKPGRGYYFIVSDNKNKDQAMKTTTFTIKRKIPLALKAIPVVLIAAAVPFLSPKPGPPNLDPPPEPPN